MSPGKYNLIRSICRSLEVLLFFVISVVGFNLFAKTTSFNSKAKAKSLAGAPSPPELSVPDITLPCDLNHLYSFFILPQHQERSSTLSDHSHDHVFTSIRHHQLLPVPYSSSNQNSRPLSFPFSKPGNLFQQNPILLIWYLVSPDFFQPLLKGQLKIHVHSNHGDSVISADR